MAKTEDGYAYNARHGEYIGIPDAMIAEVWSAPFYDEEGKPLDPDDYQPRPAWVTTDLMEDGFGLNDQGEPEGEFYLRFVCDEAGLMERARLLFNDVRAGPAGGDDDTFDYWPSGVLLLQAMIDDLTEPAYRAEAADMRKEIRGAIDGHAFEDDLVEKTGLDEE